MKKLIYFVISGVLIVLFVEMALRFSGRLRTYPEKNFGVYQSAYNATNEQHVHVWQKNDSVHSVQTEFNFSYITNSYGLAAKHDYMQSNRDSSFVFIGDSFVFGVGASKDSNVCAFLERQLPFNFINAGIPGSDPYYEKVILDSIFRPLDYKKFIFMVNFSDFYDYIFRGGEERFLPNNKVVYRDAPKIEAYYEKSLLLRGFTHFILQRDFSLQSKKTTKKLKLQAVDDFARLFSSLPKEINIVVVFQPYPSQYNESNDIAQEVINYDYLEALETKLIENNIKTINLDSRLKKLINSKNYLDYSWEIDGHFNAKGYELLSDCIINELTARYPEFLEIKSEY